MKETYYNLIMAHRYLYYVLGQPFLSDFDYDKLEKYYEKEFNDLLPPGSDLRSSYDKKIIDIAHNILYRSKV